MFQPIENFYLTISSKREANWLFYYLKWQGLVSPDRIANSISEKAKVVLEVLSQKDTFGFPTNLLVEKMQYVYSRQIKRDSEDFGWIKEKDSRLINWLYEQMPRLLSRNAELYFLSSNRESEEDLHLPVSSPELYFVALEPGTTPAEKYESIIFALDINPVTILQRKLSLEQLKKEWFWVLRKSPKLGWLTKYEVEPQRVWNHLVTVSERLDDPLLVCPLRLSILQPGTYKQIAEMIKTVIDCYYSDCINLSIRKASHEIHTDLRNALVRGELVEEGQTQAASVDDKRQIEISKKYLDEYLNHADKLVKRMRKAHDSRIGDDRKSEARKSRT